MSKAHSLIIPDRSMELIHAAGAFVFEGVTSPMIHPDTPREAGFLHKSIMPADEMYVLDRSVSVGAVLYNSFKRTLLDYVSHSQKVEGVTQIDDPARYIQLFRAGKVVTAINKLGFLRNCDDREDLLVHPLVVASGFHNVFNEDMLKDKWYRKHVFRSLQPTLAPDETPQDRREANRKEKMRKHYFWRYSRTLGLAATSAILSVPALAGAHAARADNQPVIEELEAERSNAPVERVEEIDNNLLRLKAENEGAGPYLLALSGGALLRAGYWRMEQNIESRKKSK